MARLPDLVAFAQRHGLKIGTISDLIAYRRRHDNLVRETAVETVISEYGGTWQMRIFTDTAGGGEHIVLSKGDLATPEPVLVRMHAMNPFEDMLGIHPGRSHQLRDAMLAIADEGRGVVVLLRDTSMKLDARRPRLAEPAAPVRHRRADPERARAPRARRSSPTRRARGRWRSTATASSIAGTRPIPTPEADDGSAWKATAPCPARASTARPAS